LKNDPPHGPQEDPPHAGTVPLWRVAGFWLVLAMAVLQAFYAARALLDPGAFASYRGQSLTAMEDAGWVQVYATRTLFIALFLGLLLFRRDLVALKWAALVGLVMPVGDALLAFHADAPPAIVARHVATALYLVVTFLALNSWTRRHRVR
jgi:hypothetical protein